MSTLSAVETGRAPSAANPIGELFRRQSILAGFGVLCLVCSAATYALQWVDGREFGGVDVWIKPTKFFFSVAAFSITAAWFFGYVRPERRTSFAMRFVVWTIVIAGTLETAYIAVQAGRAMASHFNITSPLYIALYAIMGVGAVMLVVTTPVMGWEILRRPVAGLQPDYRAALVIGLVLTFVLGGGLGGYMSSTLSHAVGPEQSGFPIFGWNRIGGDLRVAHFFGMHIEQALPIVAALAAPFPPPLRWTFLAIATIAAVAITLATFIQALMGQPFLPGL